jgi:general secretion pathway protein D
MKWIVAILLCFVSLAAAAQDKAPPDSRNEPKTAAAPAASKKDQKMAAEEFKRAMDLRKDGKIEEALLAATDATQLVPANQEYLLLREMIRQQIVSGYLNEGNRLASTGKNDAAAEQFKEALSRDPENTYAQQRLHDVSGTAENPDKARLMQLLAGVNNVDLQPAAGKRSIHAGPDMRSVYTQIGNAFGVFFNFDQSVTNRQIRIDLDNVDFYTVTSFLGRITKTFWAPVSAREAIVANDTQDMRAAYERMAVRTFYVGNVVNPTELNDLVNMMRTIFEMKFVTVEPGHNTITVRAPRTQVEMVASFLESVMDVKPEMVLVVNEFEFDADKARAYGMDLPTDFTVFNIPSEIRRVLGNDAAAVIAQLQQNGTIDPSKISPSELANLQGSPLLQPFIFFGKGLFGLTGVVVPRISAHLSETTSSTANLEHLNLRAEDGEAATFRVGDRFPIVTSNFTATSLNARGQISTGSTPQFQYVDLGLTLKTTPHYHSDGAIRLDFDLQVQGLGALTFNDVPELTLRSFQGNITVREGEPSVIAGMITDQEQKATSGYPGIGQIPGVNWVTNKNTSDRAHNEIIVVVTPYVIRKPFHDRGATAFWNLN